jgi:KaiC/GvpD/RAD55 family RecA-like ATPase
MKTAAEALEEERTLLRLGTGSVDLDGLIDGIQQGQFYLFYGNDQKVLDTLVHRILVNCVPPSEKRGFGVKGLYFNVCNYHQGKTILDPSQLTTIAKCAGVDPNTIFKSIYTVSAFNETQQISATEELVNIIEDNNDIRLLVVQNLTRFVETSRKPLEARKILRQVIGMLRRVASKKEISLVVTCTASKTSRGRIPKPKGGVFLRHEANFIIFLDGMKRETPPSVRATLVKHPYKATPKSLVLCVQPGGVDLMGGNTSLFKQKFQKQIDELKNSIGFQNNLINLEHKEAFDFLLKGAWSVENAAMSNSGVLCIMDILNLMANVHNKKCIENLCKRYIKLERRLKDMEERSR